jgi:hypothetical protein
MNKRPVTERDFRMPEFRDADPADYEFRDDGKVVRKDRWEVGIRNIANILHADRDGWEINDIVWQVQAMIEDAREVQKAAADALWLDITSGALYAD